MRPFWIHQLAEYLIGVYETLRAWGERLAVKDETDLKDELLVKSRHDNRLGICLRWLDVLGVTQGSFEARDLQVVRDLDPAGIDGRQPVTKAAARRRASIFNTGSDRTTWRRSPCTNMRLWSSRCRSHCRQVRT